MPESKKPPQFSGGFLRAAILKSKKAIS